MIDQENEFSIDGLAENSILYISIQASECHPMRDAVLITDPAPDYDLTRLVRLLGAGSRKYFSARVYDGTRMEFPADLSSFKGLVIGCSVHSVNPMDGPLFPWQEKLIEFVRHAVIDCKIPFLGICGGAQLGVVAFGGTIGPNPRGLGFEPDRERSFLVRETLVTLTESGECDPLLENCKLQFGMAAMHSDYMHSVPEEKGFKVLANSNDLPNQIVAFGSNVRLVGLHPEVTREFLDESVENLLDAGAFSELPRFKIEEAFSSISPDYMSNYNIVKNFLVNFCAKQ